MKTHKWVVQSIIIISDTTFLLFLLWFGITNNLFNWGADWWYSLLTLLWFIGCGYMLNWDDKED